MNKKIQQQLALEGSEGQPRHPRRQRLPEKTEGSAADQEKKFWSRVIKKQPNECWPWIGSKLKKDGRGIFWAFGRNITAPRFAMFLFTGILPDRSAFVCHKIGRASCRERV